MLVLVAIFVLIFRGQGGKTCSGPEKSKLLKLSKPVVIIQTSWNFSNKLFHFYPTAEGLELNLFIADTINYLCFQQALDSIIKYFTNGRHPSCTCAGTGPPGTPAPSARIAGPMT